MDKAQKQGIIVTIIFGGSFSLFGLLFLYFGIKNFVIAYESDNWPTVVGIITESKINRKRSESKSNGSSTSVVVYNAQVKYEYHIGKTKFIGRKIKIDDISSSNKNPTIVTLKKYPVGSKVTIFYNPKSHDYSLLEPGYNRDIFLLPFIGFGLLLFGILMTLFFWWVGKSSPKTNNAIKQMGEPTNVE
jgi:hypothetical protein